MSLKHLFFCLIVLNERETKLKVSKSQKNFFQSKNCWKRTKYKKKFCPMKARAEFCLIFRSFFGKWSFKKNCFWDLMTFRLTKVSRGIWKGLKLLKENAQMHIFNLGPIIFVNSSILLFSISSCNIGGIWAIATKSFCPTIEVLILSLDI